MVRAWAGVREPGHQVPPTPKQTRYFGQSAQLRASLGLHLLDCGRRRWARLPPEPLLALTFFKILRIIDLALLTLLTLLKKTGRGGESGRVRKISVSWPPRPNSICDKYN